MWQIENWMSIDWFAFNLWIWQRTQYVFDWFLSRKVTTFLFFSSRSLFFRINIQMWNLRMIARDLRLTFSNTKWNHNCNWNIWGHRDYKGYHLLPSVLTSCINATTYIMAKSGCYFVPPYFDDYNLAGWLIINNLAINSLTQGQLTQMNNHWKIDHLYKSGITTFSL